MAYPKQEPLATPQTSHVRLPNLGPYPTSSPATKGVQKKKRGGPTPHQLKGSISHLSPEEQIVQLRQSRKAIRNKLYSRIARLQRECNALQQDYYGDPRDEIRTPPARALRFWPADPEAKPRDLFALATWQLDSNHTSRFNRMTRFAAPNEEILIFTSASCVNQHSTPDTRSAASSCILKPTGVHPSEARSIAFRLERRGPTGQECRQESNRAHLRAAIAALQARQWQDERKSSSAVCHTSSDPK